MPNLCLCIICTLLILQGKFLEKIKYHIFVTDRISSDTQFCNRKSMLLGTWIIAILHGELESCFSQKLFIDQNIIKGHFCVKVNQCVRWWGQHGQIYVPCYTLDSDLITFSVKIMQFIKILLMDIFIPVFINEFCDGVWKCEYLYYVAISHPTSTFFCENYVLAEISSKGIFISVFVMESHGAGHRHKFPNTEYYIWNHLPLM